MGPRIPTLASTVSCARRVRLGGSPYLSFSRCYHASESIPALWTSRSLGLRQYRWNGVRTGGGLDHSWTKGRCFSQFTSGMEDKKEEPPSEKSNEVMTRGMSPSCLLTSILELKPTGKLLTTPARLFKLIVPLSTIDKRVRYQGMSFTYG